MSLYKACLSLNVGLYVCAQGTHNTQADSRMNASLRSLPMNVSVVQGWTVRNFNIKGGPEPLEKEINEILGSKREDRFSDTFFELVQNTSLVHFPYLLHLCNFCQVPRDMRKFPQKCLKKAGC